MSYFANREIQSSNNIPQNCGRMQRAIQGSGNINNVTERMNTKVNTRFRPPFQSVAGVNTCEVNQMPVTNVQSTSRHVYTNINQNQSNAFKMLMDVNRTTPVAGPSRLHQATYDAHIPSAFTNPGSSTSGVNFSPCVGNRADNIGVVMSRTQETVPRLMPIPGTNAVKKSNSVQNLVNSSSPTVNFNYRVFGSSEREKMFIFTGTVERVIKWNKIFRNHFCYFEVIAAVISIQEGSIKTQRIMLLRDRKGPILQVVYYISTHMDIEDFHVGQILRCIGKMSATNILNAISIRSASQDEIDTLQRLSLVCDQAVSHFLNS